MAAPATGVAKPRERIALGPECLDARRSLYRLFIRVYPVYPWFQLFSGIYGSNAAFHSDL